MLHNLRVPPSLMLLAFTLLTGVVYPLAVTGIGWVMMQDQALGSLVVKDGKVVGSSLVGQSFTSDTLFPSAPVGDHVGPDPADAPRRSMRPTTPRPRRAPTSGRSPRS